MFEPSFINMDLRSEAPYWLLKSGYLFEYPSLQSDLSTDVIVLGGGITGALVAHQLCMQGVEAVVIDGRKIGMGSTCASTGLLQYEIDTPLHVLIDKVGKKEAERSYTLCLESIHTLKQLSDSINIDCEFQYKTSFFYASKIKDLEIINKEYKARKEIGIEIELLSPMQIKSLFPFEAPGALFSHTAAQINPYILTHGLLQRSLKKGLQVYDNTRIDKIENSGKRIKLLTQQGHTISCKKIVYATGYESVKLIDKPIARLHSTYAIISEPLAKHQDQHWYKDTLIWETAHPYMYMRTVSNNRIIVGGKDETFYSPKKRDKLLKQKSKQLESAFEKKFPYIPFRTDYQWCGTFAETKDGLPYIGSQPRQPNAYFALGFGGNGITFSTIAAEIITDAIKGKKNKDAALFAFDRVSH